MAYARSGGRILLATRGAVHVLQRAEGRWPGRVHRFQGRTIGAAEFNRDGTQIAIAAERVAHVLDATTGGTRATLEGHSAPVLAVAFSGDGMRLATEAPIEPP